MAFTDGNEGSMVMPVSPMGSNGFGNGFGGDGWWILLLFILFGNNGFGNGFGGGDLYPWMNNSNQMANGFRDQMINSDINAIQNSINATQMAMSQGFNALGSQFADCCCENRLASADLKYTIATENCADRYEAAQNTRDIIESANRNNQAILDKLCQLELDGKNDRIADLERQLTFANLSASQTAQTAQLLADNARQTTALEQYLNPAPIPAYVVQNPNCCPNMNACGCGSF